jgi:hypothetical protein
MLDMAARLALLVMLAITGEVLVAQSARPRARDLGLAPGVLAADRSTQSPTSPACASATRR